uniref:RING-type E3 ubiquitin transferase n=1 Tax=Ananas comosus var. bracteatus TaxID=296719 RepID=A0A6V7P5R2_ANACO|nr:unnamed protein product [Ananas comosus var. bracteatus]
MSSAASPSNPAPASPLTFWCHVCDMSVSLLPSPSPPLLCPHCRGDFLEEMDAPSSPPPPPPPPHLAHLLSDSSSDSSDPDPDADRDRDPDPAPAAQAYLRRLIRHLASSSSDDVPLPPLPRRGPSPAPPSSIAALPTVPLPRPPPPLRPPLPLRLHPPLALPPQLLPPLPLPAPFPLPADPPPTTHISIRFRTLLDAGGDDDDDDGARALRDALRRIRRRRRRPRPVEAASPTQMAQAETGSSAGPANSAETVTSQWPLEGAAAAAAAAGGGAGGAGAAGRLDDEGDAVMSSEPREEWFFD